MHWFTISWWYYLIYGISWRYRRSIWEQRCSRRVESLNHFWCRAKGHPAGIFFYNPGGLEPDTTCKNCGDDLG